MLMSHYDKSGAEDILRGPSVAVKESDWRAFCANYLAPYVSDSHASGEKCLKVTIVIARNERDW